MEKANDCPQRENSLVCRPAGVSCVPTIVGRLAAARWAPSRAALQATVPFADAKQLGDGAAAVEAEPARGRAYG